MYYGIEGPRWGFAGCGIRPYLVAGYGIGSKIVAGFGIQISAGYGIDRKVIAEYWIQISRGNGIRSEICPVQKNLSKADICVAKKLVRFRQVSALDRST